jgi:hypothetical protein
MEFNAKLETALTVEFVIAENLREEIYGTLTELNKLTALPDQTPTNTSNDVPQDEVPRNDTPADNLDMSNLLIQDSPERPELPQERESSVQINCFPSSIRTEPKANSSGQIPVSKLTYLNHAELLKKYSGI